METSISMPGKFTSRTIGRAFTVIIACAVLQNIATMRADPAIDELDDDDDVGGEREDDEEDVDADDGADGGEHIRATRNAFIQQHFA
jgi:hypothetical protein